MGRCYQDWLADKAALAAGARADQLRITDQWLSDRAELLQRKIYFNNANANYDRSQPDPFGTQTLDLYREDRVWEDRQSGLKIQLGHTDSKEYVRFGSDQDEAELVGGRRDDRLYGEGGADTLEGLAGDDYLEGGAGADTYLFGGSFGKDTLADSDGAGSLQLGGEQLTGGKANGERNAWLGKTAGGTLISYRLLDNAPGSAGNHTLVITRQGDEANAITIKNFDLAKAQSADGYLGIRLDHAPQLVLRQAGGTNPFTDYDFDPGSAGSSSVTEGGAGNYVLYLSRAAEAGDSITLALSALADKFQLLTGAGQVPAGGAAVALAAGQTELHFALVQQGQVTANASVQLSANDLRGSRNSASNVLTGKGGDDTYYVGANDLVVEAANGGNDRVIIDFVRDRAAFDRSGGRRIELGRYANVEHIAANGQVEWSGGLWGSATVVGVHLVGNGGNNTVSGSTADDILEGGAGDDVIEDYYAAIYPSQALPLRDADQLFGGDGNDRLISHAGSDRLDGGSGTDTLTGGAGDDTYLLARGHGSDRIFEDDATAGNTDVALFGPGIAANQLWFSRLSNDLEVRVIGSNDKFLLRNWYLDSRHHVEQFKTSDGKVLLDSQVQNLVDAMAGFVMPAAGQTTLSPSLQSSLNPFIAANWQ